VRRLKTALLLLCVLTAIDTLVRTRGCVLTGYRVSVCRLPDHNVALPHGRHRSHMLQLLHRLPEGHQTISNAAGERRTSALILVCLNGPCHKQWNMPTDALPDQPWRHLTQYLANVSFKPPTMILTGHHRIWCASLHASIPSSHQAVLLQLLLTAISTKRFSTLDLCRLHASPGSCRTSTKDARQSGACRPRAFPRVSAGAGWCPSSRPARRTSSAPAAWTPWCAWVCLRGINSAVFCHIAHLGPESDNVGRRAATAAGICAPTAAAQRH